MKKGLHIALFLCYFNAFHLQAQVVLNELAFGGFLGNFLELKNLGPATVNVSEFWLFTTAPNNTPSSVQLSSLNLVCGSLVMAPGDIIVFDDMDNHVSWLPNLGDLGLYSTDANNFELPGDIVDYVAWGVSSVNTITQMVAVAAGQWTSGDRVNGNYNGLSIEYDGDGDLSSDWPFNNMPTICAENASAGANCDVIAGEPNIPQFDFCVGDGNSDSPVDLTVFGNAGTFSQWVVTDVGGMIIQLPATAQDAEFEDLEEGLFIMWHVAHESSITGLEVGGGIFSLSGCHAVSNPVLIVTTGVSGGDLEGGPFDFCVGDALPDFVSDIILTGNVGAASQWLITDEQGLILALPNDPASVDFDQSPAGTCLIWNVSFADPSTVPAIGQNANNMGGCFALSNPIVVNRYTPNSVQCGGPAAPEYVLIGFDDLKLERAIVHSGGIGVTNEDGDLEITEESVVTAEGTFVNGDYVRVYDGAKANNITAIPAQPTLPDFIFNNTNTTNAQDRTVGANEVAILTEAIYDDLEIASGATVTFSGNEIVFIEDLDIEDNVTIMFDQCTNIMIDKTLSIGKYNLFNPSEENVFLFVEGNAEVKSGSIVYAGIYTLGDLRIRQAEPNFPTVMHGIFIGEDVKARDYVELHFAAFNPCQPNIINANPNGMTQQQGDMDTAAALESNNALSVFPNPAKNIAYLKVNSEEDQQAEIKIFDMTNQIVFDKPNQDLNGMAIAIDVSNLPVGMYTAQITQADGTVLSQKMLVAR
jgi:Secretion system C-terminal sorting domain